MDEKNENKLIFLYFSVFYLELQLDSVKSNLKGSVNYYIIFLMVAIACSMVKTYYNVQDYYLAAIHVQRLVKNIENMNMNTDVRHYHNIILE